jgi:hypothetical protein
MPHANSKHHFRLVHYKHFDFKFSSRHVIMVFSYPVGIGILMVVMDGMGDPITFGLVLMK